MSQGYRAKYFKVTTKDNRSIAYPVSFQAKARQSKVEVSVAIRMAGEPELVINQVHMTNNQKLLI